MARIFLHNFDIYIHDGQGRSFLITDDEPSAPKNERTYQKLAARLSRIGGRRRTSRQQRKYTKALKSKLAYEGFVRVCKLGDGQISWKENE